MRSFVSHEAFISNPGGLIHIMFKDFLLAKFVLTPLSQSLPSIIL